MIAVAPHQARPAGAGPSACPGETPAAWPQGDLLRRVRQAIALAQRALQAAQAQPEALPPGPDRPLVLDKVVGEAAMLARFACLAAPHDAALKADVDALARRLAPLARGERVQARICNDPAGAAVHASAHLLLGQIGHPDPRFDRFLDEIIASRCAGGSEYLPNQRLERQWLGQLHGPAHGPIDPADLLASCAGQALDLLGCSTLDLYLFTHVVLYASDMGQRDAAWPRDTRRLGAEADAALAAALDADNLDLAAELLWTWPMLGLPWSATAQFGFELLAAVQDEHGFLPGPEFAPGRSATPEHLLRTSYHATFVMGMLCAVALRPGRAPMLRSPDAERGDEPGAPEPLPQGLLLERATQPRWPAFHASRGRAGREALAPLVVNVALRRAAAASDLGRLRAILEASVGDETLAALPAVQQAASWLLRCGALARLRQQP